MPIRSLALVEKVSLAGPHTVAGAPPWVRARMAGRKRDSAAVHLAVRVYAGRLARWFHAHAAGFAHALEDAAVQPVAKEVKPKVRRPPGPPAPVALDTAIASLPWDELREATEDALVRIAAEGAKDGSTVVVLRTAALWDQANQDAIDWAKGRAAELVGKRIVDGQVVDNPNADYAISDGTRELLRADIVRAFDDGLSRAQLRTLLEQHYAFSTERAQLIARTEISRALIAGNMAAWKASDDVIGTQWLLGSEHDAATSSPDICDENMHDGVVPLGETFSSGDQQPPAHVNCVCDCTVVLRGEVVDEEA